MSRLKDFTWLIAGMLVGALLAIAFPLIQPARAVEVGQPVTTGCVIRFTTATPAIYTNAAHVNNGCTSLSINANGNLEIRHQVAGPIITMNAEEDETLTRKGIRCGPSGGAGLTIVQCYDRYGRQVKANSAKIRGAYSNLWMSWVNAQAAP